MRNWYHREAYHRIASSNFESAYLRTRQRIQEFPRGAADAEDGYRTAPIRGFPVSIVYRLSEREIVVVAIAHASREEYWRGR